MLSLGCFKGYLLNVLLNRGAESSTDEPPTISITLPFPSSSITLSLPLSLPGVPSSTPSSTSEDSSHHSDEPGSGASSSSSPPPPSSSPSQSSTFSTAFITSSSFSTKTSPSPTLLPAGAQADHGSTETVSEITSVFTSMSGSVAVTFTTVIHPSGSLAPAPHHSSFFSNRTNAALIFTFVILIGLSLFVFLGYRFYKTVKKRRAEREQEAKARSTRYRTRIDDGDDEDLAYGGEMTEARGARILGSTFDLLRTEPIPLESDESESSSDIPRRRSLSSVDGTETNFSHSPRSTSPHLYRVTGPSLDMRSMSAHTDGDLGSTAHLTVNRLHRTPTSISNKSQYHYLTLEKLPPLTSLPESFGEDGPSRPTTPEPMALDDDQDYHGTAGRVLKVRTEFSGIMTIH